MTSILLGAAGTGTSFAIASRIRAVWGDEVRIVSVDINPAELVTTSLLSDAFVQVPLASSPEYENSIRSILSSEDIDVYVPILNEEHLVAQKILGDLAFGNLDVWSSELYANCTDKGFADQFLNSIGVPTPKIIDPLRSKSDIACFIKPRNGFGSNGAYKTSVDELVKRTTSELESLIVQEVCEGPEVTVDSFYDAQAGVSFAYCRERIETKSGVCTKARVFLDPELAEIARKIGKGLQQRGTICFQAMKGEDGWVITDLNVRSGAGTAITCSAGFDVLAAAFACRTGQDYSRFVRQIDENEEFIVTRQYAEFVMAHRR
eukprot:TRINITY_DN3303_c0_g1_i15.p1 TRINITY_DN3303_c0_g1~~TRINITY_DN3303_c0_g1_i15.p1  ORF type:complete len:319 (+),score=23.49 TRINITY_DN3303_c0_g1_i15:60-1016(+)